MENRLALARVERRVEGKGDVSDVRGLWGEGSVRCLNV